MAITINVGGSKKVSHNYDSQGVSLNVTAEVPNDALAEPQKIADTAQDLFDLVNGLLDEQITKLSQGDTKPRNGNTYQANGRGKTNGNGRGRYQSNARSNGNGRPSHNPDRPLTQAQQRAITNMAKRLDEDADAWVHHEFGVDKVTDLNVRQASEFIDTLKTAIEDQQPAIA